MNTNMHTPGPWIVADDGYGLYVHPEGRPGFTVAQPSGKDPEVTHVGAHTAEANARLIAAAPDLLAACVAVLENCTLMQSRWGDGANPRECREAERAMIDAIGKALGSEVTG